MYKRYLEFFESCWFYRRFIKDFSKIEHPLCNLLEKEAKFLMDDACSKGFECLKQKLISTLVIIFLDLSEPFDVMCTVLGVMLGQKRKKIFHPIYYSSKSLNVAQHNYNVTEQELLVVVYTLKSLGHTCWAQM